MQLTGIHTALITPFQGNALDEQGLRKSIRRQIQGGVDGLVVLGTTGEAPTLSDQERRRVMEIAVEEAKGQVTLMAGTGTYCTRSTIQRSLETETLGMDGALVITPYYNRPTQEGLFQHFKALSEETQLPLVLYHHPGRTGITVELETMRRIAELSSVIGIKEASGNINVLQEVLCHLPPLGVQVLLGNDDLTFIGRTLGASGVISVASNLLPELMTQLFEKPLEEARQLNQELMPLFRALSLESNPIPIKAALEELGLPSGPCRLPLTPMSSKNRQRLTSILNSLGEDNYFPVIENTVRIPIVLQSDK